MRHPKLWDAARVWWYALLLVLVWSTVGTAQTQYVAQFQSQDRHQFAHFGTSVDVDGYTAIVGARYDNTAGDQAGAAYIFTYTADTGWQQSAKFFLPRADPGDYFGAAVALSGPYALVGAPGRDGQKGAAYLYRQHPQTQVWHLEAELQPGSLGDRNYFGVSVALDLDYAVVGAYLHNRPAPGAGAAYVFRRDHARATWPEQAKLQGHDLNSADHFGKSVAISHNQILVGAPSKARKRGFVYSFERSGETWTERGRIAPVETQWGDEAGHAVALSGAYALIGAPYHDNGQGAHNTGAAWMYERAPDGSWERTQKFTPPAGGALGRFGHAVALARQYAVVGAPGHRRGAGRAYLYASDAAGVWQAQEALAPAGLHAADGLGGAVGLSGNQVLLGADGDDGGSYAAGSVHAYRLEGVLPAHFEPLGMGFAGGSYGMGTWGDYDNDGDLDVLLTGLHAAAPATRLYRNDAGQFIPVSVPFKNLWYSAAAWGDYDNDGDLDLVLTGKDAAGPSAHLYRNEGANFVEVQAGLHALWNGRVAWGDYDNDGHLDLLLNGADKDGAVTILYQNTKHGTFTPVDAGFEHVRKGATAWGDYDNDGDLDLILTGWNESARVTKLYNNDGQGAFQDTGAGLIPVQNSAVAWGDYDSDGDLDLILSGDTPDGPVTQLYRNDAQTWVAVSSDVPPLRHGSLAWGDFDNDGDQDLLATGWDGFRQRTEIFTNQAGAGFETVPIRLQHLTVGNAAWGDYDQDGDLDILYAGDGDSEGRADIYRNESAFATNNQPELPVRGEAHAAGESRGHLWKVTLPWGPATDAETPQPELTYNLQVGTTPGGQDVVSSTTALPAPGNAGTNTIYTLYLPDGEYYWRVQTVDGGYAASAFTPEGAFVVGVPLPVAWAGIQATPSGRDVILTWETASEAHNAGFHVEQRWDADADPVLLETRAWEQVAWVEGAGTTTENQRYQHRVRELPPGVYGFRLRQVDLDGQVTYSPEVQVTMVVPAHQLVLDIPYPNPALTTGQFNFSAGQASPVQVQVFDIQGRLMEVLYVGTPAAGAVQTLHLKVDHWPNGRYWVRLSNEDFSIMRPFVVAK